MVIRHRRMAQRCEMLVQNCHPERSKTVSNENRFAQSRDLVFSREPANARRVPLLPLHNAKRLAPGTLHRHGQQSPQACLATQEPHPRGFTDDYNCTRLVYWESFDDVHNAIGREKQLKRWRREKKLWLIAQKNPRWHDLAVDWYPTETQGPSTAMTKLCTTSKIQGRHPTLSSRAKQNDERSESFCAVGGPCVSPLGRLEKQGLHFGDARRATRVPRVAPFPIWPEALQNRKVIVLVKPDSPT